MSHFIAKVWKHVDANIFYGSRLFPNVLSGETDQVDASLCARCDHVFYNKGTTINHNNNNNKYLVLIYCQFLYLTQVHTSVIGAFREFRPTDRLTWRTGRAEFTNHPPHTRRGGSNKPTNQPDTWTIRSRKVKPLLQHRTTMYYGYLIMNDMWHDYLYTLRIYKREERANPCWCCRSEGRWWWMRRR